MRRRVPAIKVMFRIIWLSEGNSVVRARIPAAERLSSKIFTNLLRETLLREACDNTTGIADEEPETVCGEAPLVVLRGGPDVLA